MLNSVHSINENTVHAHNNGLKSVIKYVVVDENNCLPSLNSVAGRITMMLKNDAKIINVLKLK